MFLGCWNSDLFCDFVILCTCTTYRTVYGYVYAKGYDTTFQTISHSTNIKATTLLCNLSHTWVRYPGFSGHEVQYRSRYFKRIFRRSDWLYHAELMGSIRGSVSCQKNISVCEISCFGVKYVFQRRTRHEKHLWRQFAPMQETTNKWKM